MRKSLIDAVERRASRQPQPEEPTDGNEAEDEGASEDEQQRAAAGAEPETETGQNWLLRHLKQLLEDVPENTLTEFVMQQDITAFRNFLTADSPRRCLFIAVLRPQAAGSPRQYFEGAPLQLPIEPPAETEGGEQEEKKEEDPKAAEEQLAHELEQHSKTPAKSKRPMRPARRARARSISAKTEKADGKRKKKEKSPLKKRRAKSEAKREKEEKKEELPPPPPPEEPQLIVAFDLPEVPVPVAPEIALRWAAASRVPADCEEFVFVATRDEPNTGVLSEFDRIFVVGHCRVAEKFRRILDIAGKLLDCTEDFERQVDLLLQLELPLSERREKWQNAADRFENFIADALVFAFQSTPKRNQLEAMMDALSTVEVDVESIESLLRQRVRVFTKSPTDEAVVQVKLELSLFEIKFLSGECYARRVVERLRRIVTLFSVLHMLYAQTSGEWIQKALFHCVELTARILATNMHQRVWNLVYEDCEGERKPTELADEEHAAIMADIKPVLIELIELGLRAMGPLSDEFLCLEKIGQCVRIVDFIEDEFAKLRSLIADLRDPRRDMTFDRRPLDVAREIVRSVWTTFEESYFESSLESGNYDSMKNVCLQLAELNLRMTEALPQLDDFCSKTEPRASPSPPHS
ncbi:hypothetical protein M3Y99_01726700 [Aphelenchoides fujianensis]|nr:hypothetical protein M3Y99_01726700 [Aphelenchoides fujianensis]